MAAATGERSISFAQGFTHDLGYLCRSCHTTEARCAYLGACCRRCDHWRRYTPAGEIRQGPLPRRVAA